TGRIICHQLQQTDADFSDCADVVAFMRQTSDVAVLPPQTKQRVGDLENLPPDLLGDIAVVVFVAGSGSKTGPEKTVAVDQNGAMALIDLARDSGVRHFVMLSAKGAEDPENARESIRHYMRAKRAADDHLMASGLSYTICRPVSLSNEAGTGRVSLAKSVDPSGELAREDLADVLIDAMTHSALQNCVVELGPGSTPIDVAIATYSVTDC
ncbi:MAG: SDR family oxidoreductase, partial [Planctomycetota bacterium]